MSLWSVISTAAPIALGLLAVFLVGANIVLSRSFRRVTEIADKANRLSDILDKRLIELERIAAERERLSVGIDSDSGKGLNDLKQRFGALEAELPKLNSESKKIEHEMRAYFAERPYLVALLRFRALLSNSDLPPFVTGEPVSDSH
jgi:hypothetical protein